MNLPFDFASLSQALEMLGLTDLVFTSALEMLGLTDLVFTSALAIVLLGFVLQISRKFMDILDYHGPDKEPVMSNVVAIGSSIRIENSQQDDDEQPAAWDDDNEEYSSWDYDTDKESEPAPVLPQVFSACPKCGAPRKSFECEYCHQVMK